MRYATICSGIGAPEHAFRDFGWTCVFASEIDRFARAVYAHRHPDVPIYGDFRDLTPTTTGPVDLIVAGPPCTDFSIAGLRKGLAGDRGALTIEFIRLLERYGCPQFLFENVPGILSVDKGRAFGIFLGALAHLGYHLAWRSLDAQFFGAPQRRRRVFVVGDTRDTRAVAVLFEPGGVSWDSPQSEETRQDVTGTLAARTSGGGGLGTDFDLDGGVVAPPLANTLSAEPQLRQCPSLDTLIVDGRQITSPTHRGGDVSPVSATLHPRADKFLVVPKVSGTLVASGAGSDRPAGNANETDMLVAFSSKDYGADAGEIAPTLRAMEFEASHANGGGQLAVATRFGVRRLTPTECERLQSFPDGFTLVPVRTTKKGKIIMAADGPRYRALGNSMNTAVVRAIGKRLKLVNDLMDELSKDGQHDKDGAA